MDIKDYVKVGIVAAVYPERNTARVLFSDNDDLDSGELPFLVQGSYENKYYAPMPVDTQVLCLRLPNGKNAGYILGALYSEADEPPSNSGDIAMIEFADGSVVRHNHNTGEMEINTTGSVTITAGSVAISADSINITGSSGDVKVSGISLTSHKHGGVQGGSSSTGSPQ